MKRQGLKRRSVRRTSGTKAPTYETPKKQKSSYGCSKDYRYFWGHVVKEIALKLPEQPVICWYNDHGLSTSMCAINKFLKEKSYCKRCPLFQGDDYAKSLRKLIEEWERDEVENQCM